MIYFEDLQVGAVTDFGSYDVTREEVLEFARKYDPQPFHISDEAAAKTHFGRIAASGWHTAAMVMSVIARHVIAHEQAGLGSPGIDDLRWKKPVYPGDTLREGVVSTIVTNQNDEVVMTFTSIVLISRRPASAQD